MRESAEFLEKWSPPAFAGERAALYATIRGEPQDFTDDERVWDVIVALFCAEEPENRRLLRGARLLRDLVGTWETRILLDPFREKQLTLLSRALNPSARRRLRSADTWPVIVGYGARVKRGYWTRERVHRSHVELSGREALGGGRGSASGASLFFGTSLEAQRWYGLADLIIDECAGRWPERRRSEPKVSAFVVMLKQVFFGVPFREESVNAFRVAWRKSRGRTLA